MLIIMAAAHMEEQAVSLLLFVFFQQFHHNPGCHEQEGSAWGKQKDGMNVWNISLYKTFHSWNAMQGRKSPVLQMKVRNYYGK